MRLTSNGGGWTVIQNRLDGKINFNRNWDEYKYGFDDVDKEHWLGNDLIHLLSSRSSNMMVRFQGTTYHGDHQFAIFKGFRVDDESKNYKLHTGVFLKGEKELENIWAGKSSSDFSIKSRCLDAGGGFWMLAGCFNPNAENCFRMKHVHYLAKM